MGNIFCYPAAKTEVPVSNALLIQSSEPQQEKKTIIVKNAHDLLGQGFEYRFVACRRHSADTQYVTTLKCEECTTRLFHLNDPITAENRKQYIPDGSFFDQVSDVCQELVQERLVNDHKLKFVTLYKDQDEPDKIIKALVNENYDKTDNPEDRPTLIIMTGKGKSRAGILSVKHLLISGIEVGSASYHIEQALTRNWNVICLDPNAWGVHHGLEVLEKSLDKILDDGVRKTAPVAMLAHSAAGGYIVRYLLTGKQRIEVFQRLQCIAFTDSTHRLPWARNNARLHDFLQSNKCVYIRNNSLGSEFPHVAYKQPKPGEDCKVDEWWRGRFGSLPTVWAGTTDHSLVCWMARKVVWEFFEDNKSDNMNC